jgi:protein SCO1
VTRSQSHFSEDRVLWAGCPPCITWLLAGLCVLSLAAVKASLPPGQRPPILHDVGIDQHLDVQVPPGLVFRDELGQQVHLGDYFGKRPIVLALVYYKCPMLCTMVLNDLTRAMNSMKMNCGEQFDIITVSFNPRETPDLAKEKKDQYIRAYRRPHAEEGWHFLTGSQPSIDALTKTVGFRYAWDAASQQYAHASGLIILTPEGKTSRYFYGIDYAPSDLELSLAEASHGQVTSVADQILLYCFHYDPTTGRYSLRILRAVQAGGILTLLALAVGIVWMTYRHKARPAGLGPGGPVR